MDGVLYRGNRPLDGAATTLSRLQEAGNKVYLLTNNSGSTRQEYLDKLHSMNMSVPLDRIYTSAFATAIYLRDNGAVGKNVFCIGQGGVIAELKAVGLNVFTESYELPSSSIDYVVVGIDRQFNYDKLRFAHECIAQGHARFIATNRDATYPVEGGTIPGAGSIVASVATATGLEPLVIGKPEPYALKAIILDAHASINETIMIGDRLDTDIAAGKRLGTKTALVLTGVSTRSEAENASPSLVPDRIIGNLTELLED